MATGFPQHSTVTATVIKEAEGKAGAEFWEFLSQQ
jgi:hypothetical protein